MQKILKVFRPKPNPMSKSLLMLEEPERPVVTTLSINKKIGKPQGNLTKPLWPPPHTGGQRTDYQTAHGKNGGKETLINRKLHVAGSTSHVVSGHTPKPRPQTNHGSRNAQAGTARPQNSQSVNLSHVIVGILNKSISPATKAKPGLFGSNKQRTGSVGQTTQTGLFGTGKSKAHTGPSKTLSTRSSKKSST
eukprot:2434909-Pleurochrysis_carterae.AAC.1